jgi:hypothetical protein
MTSATEPPSETPVRTPMLDVGRPMESAAPASTSNNGASLGDNPFRFTPPLTGDPEVYAKWSAALEPEHRPQYLTPWLELVAAGWDEAKRAALLDAWWKVFAPYGKSPEQGPGQQIVKLVERMAKQVGRLRLEHPDWFDARHGYVVAEWSQEFHQALAPPALKTRQGREVGVALRVVPAPGTPEVTTAAENPASQRPESDEHWTDLGNAMRLVRAYGAHLRYSVELGWLVYTGQRWTRDRTGEVHRCANAIVRELYDEALALEDKEDRADALKTAIRLESEPRLRAMVARAESEASVTVLPEQFDADPWALNLNTHTCVLRKDGA